MSFSTGGETVLRWTNAWRGLLTLHTRDYAVSHQAHVHDYYTIGLCEGGEANLWCRGEEFRIRPGSVFLISPWEVHSEIVTSGRWTYRAFHPVASTMKRVLGFDSGTLRGLEFTSPVVECGALSDSLRNLFARLETEPNGLIEDAGTDAVRAHLRRELRLKSDRTIRGVRSAEWMRQMIVNSSGPMPSQKELAGVIRMSRFHISRVFNEIVGLPPYAYYEQVRLARAKVLLRQGLSISAAATTVGFSDQSHLHRQFRARSDSTPGEYARAVRGVFAEVSRRRLTQT